MILAIDPSNTRHAWAIVNGTPSSPVLVAFGRDLRRDPLPEECGPDGPFCMVAVEFPASYGMAVGAHIFDTCYEIGRLMSLYPQSRRITRIEVKRLVCHRTSANDANIRAAIIDRFGGPQSIRKGGPLYKVGGDCWAAIAVGLAAMEPDCKFYVPVAERG